MPSCAWWARLCQRTQMRFCRQSFQGRSNRSRQAGNSPGKETNTGRDGWICCQELLARYGWADQAMLVWRGQLWPCCACSAVRHA